MARPVVQVRKLRLREEKLLAPVSAAGRVYIKFIVQIGRFGPWTNIKLDRIWGNV